MEKVQKSGNLYRSWNLGLCILRSIMCFLVVLCHFWDGGGDRPLEGIRGYAVPVFMVMSFMLNYKTLKVLKKNTLKKRFRRLLFPHIVWALIYWMIYASLDVWRGWDLENGPEDLFWQMLTGHCTRINAAMWYQTDSIFLTAVFILVLFIFREYYKTGFSIMLFLAILFQYSGRNFALFEECRNEVMYPAGRICEMIPLAVLGFFIADYGICEKLKERWKEIVLLSAVLIFMIRRYAVFSDVPGYGYSGLNKIVPAVILVTVFNVLPLDKIPEKLQNGIGMLTRYTMGIYCMHMLCGRLLNIVLGHYGIVTNTFLECIVIYSLCYIGSFLISKIPIKVARQLVE